MALGLVNDPTESEFSEMESALVPAINRVRSTAQSIKIESPEALQSFLRQYVFWVWGEAHLLRTLEERLASSRGPWVPPQDALVARRVRELSLEEESGEVEPQVYLSRFELFLSALDELKSETIAIDTFLHRLALTGNVEVSLKDLHIPEATQRLILWFHHSTQGSSLEIASRLFGLRKLFWFSESTNLAARLSADFHIPLASLHTVIEREQFLRMNWNQYAPLLIERLCSENAEWATAREASTEALRQAQDWLAETKLLLY